MVEAAGVELSRVLITRNLLILGTATTVKKASLPNPLYVYCTKMLFALESRRPTQRQYPIDSVWIGKKHPASATPPGSLRIPFDVPPRRVSLSQCPVSPNGSRLGPQDVPSKIASAVAGTGVVNAGANADLASDCAWRIEVERHIGYDIRALTLLSVEASPDTGWASSS
jgi:hypothetical protein